MIATVHFHGLTTGPEIPMDRVSIKVADDATDAEIFTAARRHLIRYSSVAHANKYPTMVLVEKSEY